MQNQMTDLLEQILANPNEGNAVELKRWLNLSNRSQLCKVIKACAALYNSNGGFLLVGVTDDGQPDTEGRPTDWEIQFEAERLQGFISNHLTPPFEITVWHAKVGQEPCVVIEVPAGATSPVCVRVDVADGEGNTELARFEVFCRTLSANGTYSSGRPGPDDWQLMMRRFLDNREADIARFLTRNFTEERVAILTRQLVELERSRLGHPIDLMPLNIEEEIDEYSDNGVSLEPNALSNETSIEEIDLSLHEMTIPPLNFDRVRLAAGSSAARACLSDGFSHYLKAIENVAASLPNHGSWEVAAVINGNLKETNPTENFLNTIASANPTYTYVPFWITRRGRETGTRPYVLDRGWESLILEPPRAINFWRAEPRGFFYLYRALEDDMTPASPRPEPLTAFEFSLQIIRMADAIAVVLAIANALPMRNPANSVEFLFRWRGLAGRKLSSWANPKRLVQHDHSARQNEYSTSLAVPTDATKVAVADYVSQATAGLFALFDGATFEPKVIADIVSGVFERKT
jgi:hypothetical protein